MGEDQKKQKLNPKVAPQSWKLVGTVLGSGETASYSIIWLRAKKFSGTNHFDWDGAMIFTVRRNIVFEL